MLIKFGVISLIFGIIFLILSTAAKGSLNNLWNSMTNHDISDNVFHILKIIGIVLTILGVIMIISGIYLNKKKKLKGSGTNITVNVDSGKSSTQGKTQGKTKKASKGKRSNKGKKRRVKVSRVYKGPGGGKYYTTRKQGHETKHYIK